LLSRHIAVKNIFWRINSTSGFNDKRCTRVSILSNRPTLFPKAIYAIETANLGQSDSEPSRERHTVSQCLNILIIEDDPALGDSLEEYLSAKGNSVTWLQDERGLETRSLQFYQVVVLDLILQFISGEQVLGRIRQRSPELPVLILTAKQGIGDKRTCFEAGADDYLTKPFEPLELLLRLQALCKRDTEPRVHRCGDVEIDLNAQLVYKNGRELRLSGRAWDLLLLLLQNRDGLVSKEQIMERVWSDAVVTDNVIRYYIKELRRVLPEGSIETYKGRGYRLVDC